MTKCLTTVDGHLLEVHFARETIVCERFSVTTTGWHSVWLMTKYGPAFARTDELLVKADAIVWARYIYKPVWSEIDPANLIPQGKALSVDASRVVLHRQHEIQYEGDEDRVDECGVKTQHIEDFGPIYYVEDI